MQHEEACSRKVLVIEDDDLLARAVCDMLEDLGFEVRREATAEAGQAFLETQPVALVLSDIALPGRSDGFALARQVRLRHPAIRVLLMTGNAAKARDAADEFTVLQKPFGPRQLVDALKVASFKG